MFFSYYGNIFIVIFEVIVRDFLFPKKNLKMALTTHRFVTPYLMLQISLCEFYLANVKIELIMCDNTSNVCKENACKNTDDIILCERTQNMITFFLLKALSLHLSVMCLGSNPTIFRDHFSWRRASNLRVSLKAFTGPPKKRSYRGPFTIVDDVLNALV